MNEYFIVLPICRRINLDIYTNLKPVEINLNEIFERRTNTNYYISFNNIISEFCKMKLNNKEVLSINTFEKLNPEENSLSFIIERIPEKNHYIIEYLISIEETYDTICEININIINNCYESCAICSVESSDSSKENHNCIKCKDNYFPFGENGTNCYTKEDVEYNCPGWYFNNETNFFDKCNDICNKCDGPTEYNCLKCRDNFFIYNGTCLEHCPNGTFNSINTDGSKKCEQCYENCETCKEKGTSDDMHCTSCSDNKIKFREECFKIHDKISKTFFNPKDTNIVTSCYEYKRLYIKENENECIEDIEKGYFISNSTTGLLSKCHELCENCSMNYTETKENCDTCIQGYVKNENKCIKCHENCLSCNEDEEKNSEGKLINMKCTECKNKTFMIKIEGNCFPIISYNNNAILFNISDIKSNNTLGNCLYFNKSIFYGSYECIDKPINTFYVLNDSENTGVIKKCDIIKNISLSQINSDLEYNNDSIDNIERENITHLYTWNKESNDINIINNISSSHLNTDYEYANGSNSIKENIITQLSTMNDELNIINTTENEIISENIDLSADKICYYTCKTCKDSHLINKTENIINQNCINCIEEYI